MNFNSNREYLDHLIALARAVTQTEKDNLQNAFNDKRVRRVEKAVSTRPIYHRINYQLEPTGRYDSYPGSTVPTNLYEQIILGLVTNNPEREVVIHRPDDNLSFAYVGDNPGLRLKLGEIAGVANFAGVGQRGVFYLPNPIDLKKNDKLSIEVFKPDTTPGSESLDIITNGYRIYQSTFGEGMLTQEQQDSMSETILKYNIPQMRELKCEIKFNNEGKAELVRTPNSPEALLIRGVRSTLKNSLMTCRIEGEESWMKKPIPVYAFADYPAQENYRWFEKDIFLAAENNLVMDFVNAMGDDADAPTGTMTFYCQTA